MAYRSEMLDGVATATMSDGRQAPAGTGLVRSLTLTHAVLYGVGVTIGAGIYVLVGVAAGKSGMWKRR